MDEREIFLLCKNQIEDSDFNNLAFNLIQLKIIKADNLYIDDLRYNLNIKLEETCEEILIKANSIDKLDDELERLKESLVKIKSHKNTLKNYIDTSVAVKLKIENNGKLAIENEVIKIIKKLIEENTLKDIDNFLKEKTNRELLCSLVGSEILDEISKKVNSSDQDINSKNYDFIQDYNECSKDLKSKVKNESENAILKVLNDLKIKNEEDLHNRIVNSILEKGLNAISDYNEEISPNKLSSLKIKINELIPPSSDASSSQDLMYILNELNTSPCNENELKKVIGAVLIVLNESKIETDENFHLKIAVCIIKNGLNNIQSFENEIPPKKYSILNEKLNSCEIIRNFFANIVDQDSVLSSSKNSFEEITISRKKYSLIKKITFERFNSLEGFKKSLQEIIKEISNLEGLKFANDLFTLMIYLIKRQQSLKDFIKELKYQVEEKHQIKLSLKELLYNLLLNCEDEVKIKIYQLLNATNPVPFLNYFFTNDIYRLDFHPETYWIADNSINTKIISFSLDSKCKGKTRLLNNMFITNFEETIKDSIYFNSTMDLQIIQNFGSINNNYCLIDTHGVADLEILNRIANRFDALIMHVNESSLQSKEIVNSILSFVSKAVNSKIFIFIRDCKKDLKRKDCTNQEINRKILSNLSPSLSSLFMNMTTVKLCMILNLVEKSSEADDFTRDIRDFIFKEMLEISESDAALVNDNLLEIYKKIDQDKINSIKSNAKLLTEKLENAIKNDGIKQKGYFSIYPFYFEINLLQNELNKLVNFAINSEKCNDLRIRISILNNQMENYIKKYIKENTIENAIIPEIAINKILKSKDFILILSFLIKQVNPIFQNQLNEKLKKKEFILNKMRQDDIKVDSGQYKILEKDLIQLNTLIDQKRISAEIIWRELILIYNYNKLPIIKKKYKEIIFKGQPFEILDGDNFQFNKDFLLDVFESQQLRIRVISILGPQNSGKSTLLNFMFGCDFSVSDGRCTRGIYGSLIKSNNPDFDYYLVLDTEGLQSIEKGDKEYDRKLILFCFAVSNILIINSKDQINDDIRQTLEICVDSLSKIEQLKVPQPSVFFVMNQKADPNRKTDQDAVNKIILSFTANGLISHLKMDEKNFETLPSAFNNSITKLNEGKNEVRRFPTSLDFSERVCRFTNNLIEQITQIESHEAFSNIYKWIDFSNTIFETINSYPDLTFFHDINERIQEKKLQDHLTEKFCTKLSPQVRDNLFNEIDTTKMGIDDAIEKIEITFYNIKTELLNDLNDYTKRISVNEKVKNIKKDLISTHVNQFKDAWTQTLKIRIRERNIRHVVSSGEGIINDRIKYLLKSVKMYEKNEAELEFNKLFDERSCEIIRNINETIEHNDDCFELIYSIYKAFEKQNLPSKKIVYEFMQKEKIIKSPVTQSHNLFRSTLKLEEVVKEFKTIDKQYFKKIYDEITLNLLEAIEFILSYFDFYDENQLQSHLKDFFNLKLKYGKSLDRILSVHDLEIVGMPPPRSNELTPDVIKSKMYSLRNKSKINVGEFFLIIKKFINSNITKKEILYLIFDESSYNEKIDEVIRSIKIDSEEEINHECIQSLILKLDEIFEEYNKDFQAFDLSLSTDAKEVAHLRVFKELKIIYSTKVIEKSEKELSIWQDKKKEMCQFFVSQLSPDQSKDEENSKQFLRLFSEILEKNFIGNCKELIEAELQKKENLYTRSKIQTDHYSALDLLSKSDLLEFVLEPTDFLIKYFQIIWSEFENSLNKKISNQRQEIIKQFDNLKECFKLLGDSILKLKKTKQTFKVQEIISNINQLSSSEINHVCHLKGLCACEMIFNLICCDILTKKFIANDKDSPNFELTSTAIENFQKIRENMIPYGNKELKKVLVQLQPELKSISIDYIDLFVFNISKLVDEKKQELKLKVENYSFEKDFKKDTYFNRVKGCGTKCPCCGRLCDAEHYLVKTEIGRHACNQGHQFRGMNGYKEKYSNYPSFKICDTMNDLCTISSLGKTYKWSEFKKLYPKWNFENDSVKNTQTWTAKCTYIWSIIGKDLCIKYDMKPTSIAVDSHQSQFIEPIHFILVLDDSGSMVGEREKELDKSVEKFLKVRTEEGSSEDLVTIIYFATTATIEISRSKLNQDLIKQIDKPNVGGATSFSAALERVIEAICLGLKHDENMKFVIIFMSDGEGSYPSNEISLIKNNYLAHIHKFWCIGYGDGNFDILKQMVRELYGNEINFKNPQESLELEKYYVEIARDENL